MSELSRIQRAVGRVLIPEARAAQSGLPPESESLPIALELFYVAFAMKPSVRRAGELIAQRYASRMGLDVEAVEAFALNRLNDCVGAEDEVE